MRPVSDTAERGRIRSAKRRPAARSDEAGRQWRRHGSSTRTVPEHRHSRAGSCGSTGSQPPRSRTRASTASASSRHRGVAHAPHVDPDVSNRVPSPPRRPGWIVQAGCWPQTNLDRIQRRCRATLRKRDSCPNHATASDPESQHARGYEDGGHVWFIRRVCLTLSPEGGA